MGIRVLLALTIFISALNANAWPHPTRRGVPDGIPPKSKAEFCEFRKDPQYFRALAFNVENHLTLKNQGGLFNGGVCWWHNLFQRSALYLSVFRPELPKPNKVAAKKIIKSLAAGMKVVEIPGYQNLSQFSRDWENEIQLQLEAWQREDGFLKFAWIQGISGNWHTDPTEIAKTLNYVLGRNISVGEIQWTMWQVKGISSHASLDIGGGIQSGLYSIRHIDSNFPREVRTFTWSSPARSVESYFGKFVPYVARKSDFKYFKSAAENYCASRGDFEHDFFAEKLRNDIE